MSPAEHRAMGEQHEGVSSGYESQNDPSLAPQQPWDHQSGRAGSERLADAVTLSRARQAFSHDEHARQHLATARALEGFENWECMGVKRTERPICPLIGTIERVEEISNGVLLHLNTETTVEAVLKRMRCHHAFATVRRFEEMGACPLYMKKVAFRKAAPGIIEITGPDAATTAELQHRAATHAAPAGD